MNTNTATTRKGKSETLEIFGTKYFSVEYVSKLFGGVSTQCINQWALKGLITATKIGKYWYFTEEDIKDYLNEKTKIGAART